MTFWGLEVFFLRFENKQSSADVDDHGGTQREGSTTVQPGLSWGE